VTGDCCFPFIISIIIMEKTEAGLERPRYPSVNYILRENSRKVVTWFRYSPWRSISNFSGHSYFRYCHSTWWR